MELLGEIFDRTLRYHVYEEILESPHIGQDDSENVQQLRTRMRDRLVLLYAEILKAQIALARRFARSSFLQYGRDIVKFDSWISMSEEIMKRDADLVVDIQTLDIILGQTLVRQYNNLEADYRGLYSLVESQAQITKDKQNQEFLQFFASTFSYQSTADKVDNPIKGK